jgi:soluble lytic murein transglycosylase
MGARRSLVRLGTAAFLLSLLAAIDAGAQDAPAGRRPLGNGHDDSYAAVRAEFLAALEAAASGGTASRISDTGSAADATISNIAAAADADAASALDSPALRAYPLYPYLEAARIEHALGAADLPADPADARAAAFLARHGTEPVTRDVVRAWLSSLARREDWRAFLARYNAEAADDTLRCQALRARIALGLVTGIAREIVAAWLTGNRLPTECEPAFEWLRGEGLLTDDLVAQRVVLLLRNGQAGFARVIARSLPAGKAAPLLQWADLLEKPLDSIDALLAAHGNGIGRAPLLAADGGGIQREPVAADGHGAQREPFGAGDGSEKAIRREALLAGWSRLARNDPAAALERYDALVEALGLGDGDKSQAALALALGLAWDRRPEALDYFERVAKKDVDDYALEWWARAALWAGDWRLAAKSIDSMSEPQRNESRWLYFRARAAEKLRDRGKARELYSMLLPRDNYYAALAAARLGEPAAPHAETLRADDAAMARIAALPAFVRARELYYAGLPWNASNEWYDASAALDDDARTQTIHLALHWGWYDLAIATATRQGVFNDYALLYPRPYSSAVGAAAALAKLEPALVYALIRQESLYRRDAASHAGAVGLAQLMPDTARRVAADWSLPKPSWSDLLVPEINVKLGAAKLRSLIGEFDGQLAAGLAAYNAGANAVRRWLPEHPMDCDVWVENIPYNETRNFVQRVLWHSLVFAWLDEREPRSTEAWLDSISNVSPPVQ